MKKVVIWIFISIVILLQGCAVNNQYELANYEKRVNEAYPPISVFYQRLSKPSLSSCKEYDAKSILHHCTANSLPLQKLKTSFENTGQFSEVHYANEKIAYQILISTSRYSFETGKEIGQAALSGASLLLLPVSTKFTFKVDVSLTWYGSLIKKLSYDIPIVSNVNLFTADQDLNADVAKSITSHVVKDIQKEELFSAKALIASIESSDYEKELVLPEYIGEYHLENSMVFNNPFLGAQNRYKHNTFQFDYIDAFVYPIRSPRIQNDEVLIEQEVSQFKEEVKHYIEESQITDFTYLDEEMIKVDSHWVKKVKGCYKDSQQRQITTVMYLSKKEDKFIKLRTTYEGVLNNDSIESFAKAAITGFEVPTESKFMSRVREKWRKHDEK